MPTPGVTIVIPCYNHGGFVAAATRSALEQPGADTRVVIVDDGSDDGTTPAACDRSRDGRVRVIHQENRGLSAARNAGARGAETDYLVFLDADDRLEPAFCSTLSAALRSAPPEASHSYCQERITGIRTGLWRVPDWDPMLLLLTNLHPVTAMVRRDRFEAVGGFDETLRDGYEDWDLWLRFAGHGWKGVRVREPLFVWNRHSPDTMIAGSSARHAELFRALVDRHRAMYERHAMELLCRAGDMLARADMNWIDEDGEPINLRALEGQRAMYESMAAVRLHHAVHGAVSALPGPLSRGARRVLATLKRLAPRRGGSGHNGSNCGASM
jgi:glycosyltransferase involved in cell wall biosynthesis